MEFPCPSLDNIPLPDGAPQTARLRDRKKPTTICSQPAVSPGTSNPKISTDGQLTPFNMADVPLPSTNYNVADTQTLSIPLPEGTNSSSSAPSKTLVDKLFEDFLSQIKQPEPSTPKVESTSKPAFTNSVEEIKRFLDKEINQLSCKAGFSEAVGGASGIGADGIDVKNLIAAEMGEAVLREESTGAENASTGVNQRSTPVALPLKIKISDSSVARISSGHLSAPSCDQSQPDEFVIEIHDEIPVIVVEEDEIQPIAKAVCSKNPPENETEAQTDPVAPETDHGSNGVAEVVEAKPSKSSKKHKHKKKKSHKHSKDKNKSTPKLRLHSKKHKSMTKSHSKNKHKSSNGTKSPKKTSKTSHSKSKSSKKSKKTKTKAESKSKQLAESSEAESKSTKKSKTRSSSPEKQSTEDQVFGKTSALGKILNENSALKSSKKEDKLLFASTINSDRKSRSRSRSKSPECSPAKKLTEPKCNLIQKDTSLSPFQAKTLPLKVFSSQPLPSLADPTSYTPVTTSVALVTPVTASSVLQAATMSAVSLMAPPLQSQPYVTSSPELPAVSHPLESVSQSVSVPLSTVPTATQPDMLMQTVPDVSPALISPPVSKLSPPLSLSSPLNRSSVLSPFKSLLPVQELGGHVSLVTASLGIPPSLGIFNKSQEKDTLPNCSQTSFQTGTLAQSICVSEDVAKDSGLSSTTDSKEPANKVGFSLNPINKNYCVSSPVEWSEQADKVSSSLKPLTKNSTAAGQSGLLGLAAYFKSKAKSPSPEPAKDRKLAKSSGKKTKCSSDSSDESSPKKRSRSASRKSSHSRSLSRSGIGKHSSSDKRKKTRPRPKKSRSSSGSRSRSRSKSGRRPALKATKKRSRSRSRSRSNDRSRQSSFRSSKRRFSRSPSRSRNKTYGRSKSRSRSRGRNRVTGHHASRSRSPSKRATYRRTRSRSRSYSRGRYRHHISSRSNKSKSRSRSRSRSDVRSRDKRSRSRSSGRHRDYRQSNNKYRRFSRRRSRSRSRSSSATSSHSRRHRSRSKSNSLGIDKVKLHDIAVKKLLESGQAPKEEVASLRAGGKTVQGLIDYCKRISQKELESDSDGTAKAAPKSDDDEESPFIHHPFKIRETQPNIVLNIKNAKPLPVLTPQEKLIQSSTLRLQFPVSSGSQHRAKESPWVPVQKNTPSATEESASSISATDSNLPNPIADAATTTTTTITTTTAAAVAAYTADGGGLPSETSDPVSETAMVAGTTIATPDLQSQTIETKATNVDNVFPDIPHQNVDISQVMTERMLAVQKLQENPNDVQALNVMYKAQQEVNRWAQSKQLPGQFTGSTGAKVMTQEELNGPDKRFQAWAKKEQLSKAAPVQGGIGMHLLQKMGWRQGEGLGKHSEGSTEPILVNVKVDRKGLTSHGEDPKKSLACEVAGKHPVSALVELCSKCKWGTPLFQQVEEKGPDHKKSFMFKVTVNNITYQPTMPSNSKKNGRARAAILCLQDLGLLPKNFVI